MKLETIIAGRIVNAHGIRGELRVQPRDGDPAFLTKFKTFLLDGRPVSPTVCRPHKSLVLMKLPGVDDMNAALALKGKDLLIRREDARLPPGEYFDDELLGLDVYDTDSGECLGELVAVEAYPAHRIYTVRGQREFLVPAVKDVFIKSIDMEDNRMEIHVWEGMTADED